MDSRSRTCTCSPRAPRPREGQSRNPRPVRPGSKATPRRTEGLRTMSRGGSQATRETGPMASSKASRVWQALRRPRQCRRATRNRRPQSAQATPLQSRAKAPRRHCPLEARPARVRLRSSRTRSPRGLPPETLPCRPGGLTRPRVLQILLREGASSVVPQCRFPAQDQALGRLRPRPPRSLRPRPAAPARRRRPGPPRSRRAWPRTPGARASRSTLPAAARTGASSASPRRPRWPAGTPRRRLRSTRNMQRPCGRRARRGPRRRH